MGDDEIGQARRLHHVDETPIAAAHGILAGTHGHAGVWLADGAAHGILPVGAGAAAAGDLMPVHGVALGVKCGQCQQQACKYQAKCLDSIFHIFNKFQLSCKSSPGRSQTACYRPR